MDIEALAKQYLREYRRTGEFDNWDAVIELGKQLADAVLANQNRPRSLAHDSAGVKLTFEEKELIKTGAFVSAVKAVRIRTGLGLAESKDICDDYRRTLKPYYR